MDELMMTSYLKSFLDMQSYDQVGEIMKTKNVYFEYAFVAYEQHDRLMRTDCSKHYSLEQFIALSEDQRKDMLIDILSHTPNDYIHMIFKSYLEFVNGITTAIPPSAKPRYVYMCLAATELHSLKTVNNVRANQDDIRNDKFSTGDYVYTNIVYNTIEHIGTTIFTPYENCGGLTFTINSKKYAKKTYTTDILIWLPTLDQLFEIFPYTPLIMNLRMKAFFDDDEYSDFISKIKAIDSVDNILRRASKKYRLSILNFSSCEIMLCYIMYSKYGKIWDDINKQWMVSNI